MLIPFIRTIILYFLIVLSIRFMGKRQVGEMQPIELVITILISSVASVPMQDINIPLAHGAIPVLTLIATEILVSTVALKFEPFRRLLSGNPISVIQNGVPDQTAMKRLRLSVDDILVGLRQKDVFDIRHVRYAQVETNGQLSVLLDSMESPATAKMLSLSPSPAEPFHVLISDGRFSRQSLSSLGKSKLWMDSIIKANGATRIDDVFLLCADKRGNIIFTKKEK